MSEVEYPKLGARSPGAPVPMGKAPGLVDALHIQLDNLEAEFHRLSDITIPVRTSMPTRVDVPPPEMGQNRLHEAVLRIETLGNRLSNLNSELLL